MIFKAYCAYSQATFATEDDDLAMGFTDGIFSSNSAGIDDEIIFFPIML